MQLQDSGDSWAKAYELPPRLNMMKNKDRFVASGTRIFATIERCIKTYKRDKPIEALDILEFGCGVGRIALPFFHKYGRPNACVDVSRASIEYLKKTIPGANPEPSVFQPPLRFADGSFDAIYSISVWTHLEPSKGDAWLLEMRRLLRPGGLALISTSSFGQLEKHRRHPKRGPQWRDVSDDDLRKQGRIFRDQNYEGMKGAYGCTVHDPDWIRRTWSELFEVKATLVREVGGSQDLNVLVKPK
jgi:SAM-dependent methyltransferase